MQEVKEKLLLMQSEIIDAIEREREQSASAITHDIGDSIDLASEERDREFYQLLSERDRIKLQKIKNAIERIDNGTYGECVDCGGEIRKVRLMAMPFAELCISCKSEQERITGRDGLSIELPTPTFTGSESDELSS